MPKNIQSGTKMIEDDVEEGVDININDSEVAPGGDRMRGNTRVTNLIQDQQQ